MLLRPFLERRVLLLLRQLPVLVAQDSAENVRDAISHSLMETGSYVEAVASCDEAIEFMIVFRPDWILVGEDHASQLLLWLRSQEALRAVPVVLLPDLGSHRRARGATCPLEPAS